MAHDLESARLPRWLKAELPQMEDPQTLDVDAEGNMIIVGTDGEITPAADLRDADAKLKGKDFQISKKFYAKYAPTAKNLSYDNEDGTVSMMFPRDDYSRISFLESDFQEFLEATEEYLKEPGNFVKAFSFIQRHPALWTRPSEANPWVWQTEDGVRSVRIYVYEDYSDGYAVELEAGEHVKPDFLNHYHDPALDTKASTYESAIVKLAYAMLNRYTLEGDARDEAPEEPLPWLQEFEAQIMKLRR